MLATLETESTLTDRFQTTVPEAVRRALRLGKRDRIHYTIRANEVVLSRSETPEHDPVIGKFLDFLVRDIDAHPERLQSVDASFVQRLRALTAHVDVNLDAPLPPDE
ncbi:MAG: type II toxin-antitoxin system PrlF family antitoxin [Azoarcus sp.]|jgi:antitoxin PrlF|nr:type II toxin-antitoxin system PrlF family antitoxin [Azoarcus sp.]